MKWLFWGVCSLALLIGIRMLGGPDDRRAVPEYEPALPAMTEAGSEQELRAENTRLREHINQLNKEIVQLKNSVSGNHSSQQGIEISQASDESMEQEKIKTKIEEFNNFLVRGDSIAVLKASFANEMVDSAWASIHQSELEAFFKNSFTDVFPQYIECRSKRCKVTISASDQEKFSELSQELTQNILNNKDGIAKAIVIEPTENDGTLSFYLARNDEVNFLQ